MQARELRAPARGILVVQQVRPGVNIRPLRRRRVICACNAFVIRNAGGSVSAKGLERIRREAGIARAEFVHRNLIEVSKRRPRYEAVFDYPQGSTVLAVDLNKDGAMDIVTSTDRGTFIFWGKPGRSAAKP